MRAHHTAIMVGWAVFALAPAAAGARSIHSIYDMDRFLKEPHPFAAPPGPPAAAPPAPAQPPPAPTPRPRIQAGPAPAPTVAKPAETPARAHPSESAEEGLGGFISEIRGGVLYHDEGPFSHRKEEGADVNLELLFVSPGFLDLIGSPRPHLGADVNVVGDTSEFYLGLSWEWEFWGGWLAGFSLGGAVHTGETDKKGREDRKELGCRVLFRESIELGYRFQGRHSLTAMLDHISNAKLCDGNEGLENVGVRYGYKF
jgi:lipid A 3-O-deacylase